MKKPPLERENVGSVPDHVLAKRLGCSPQHVFHYRSSRGIPSFAETLREWQLAQIRPLLAGGKDMKSIAATTGITYPRVCVLCRHLRRRCT